MSAAASEALGCEVVGAPQPIRLRPASSASIGTTAFFRNRALLDVLLQQIALLASAEVCVLVHACSIGAEVWSLLIAAELDARTKGKRIRIAACDLNPEFVAYAERGVYPRTVLAGMRPDEQSCFEPFDADCVRVCERLRANVEFLPAQSVTEFATDRTFDVVLLLNALLYVPGELQSRTIDRIASHNRELLVTTGFHFDRIKADMRRNGYAPVNERAQSIHDGWTDRRRDGPARDETVPGKIYHGWSLPAFSEIEDYRYKYCSIFRKHRTGA
jgi:CheR methyltransferase, SAM binding domain